MPGITRRSTRRGPASSRSLPRGRLREALDGAQALLQRARAAGEQAYSDADYDLAVACFLLTRVLQMAGGSEQALPLLDKARRRFEAVATARANKAAEQMAPMHLRRCRVSALPGPAQRSGGSL